MNSNIAIQVDNLSKKYVIGTTQQGSLRHTLSSLFKTNKTEEFWALKDVSFTIEKGDAVGIIGRNGAGKSTLLKILSKITEPTSGRILMHGRVASLLEVGTGFHHELTGRENIFLNGSLLGMTRSEIKSKLDEIIDFSGVERFIDTPVKHYSSGMYVRLAFSVAAHLNTEILLVDEVLAVGDAEFQKKCLGKMDDVTQQGKTVLLVSHDMNMVESLCGRTIIFNKGEIITSKADVFFFKDEKITKEGKFIRVSNLGVLALKYLENVNISFDFFVKNSFTDISLFIGINNSVGKRIFTSISHHSNQLFDFEKGTKYTININIPRGISLHPGAYDVEVGLVNKACLLVEKLFFENVIVVDKISVNNEYFGNIWGVLTVIPDWSVKPI